MTMAKKPSRIPTASIEVPKFRYIDDVSRFLESLRSDVDEGEKLVNLQQKALATLIKGQPIVAALGDRIIDSQTKRTVPGIEKLKNQYGLSEDLYTQYRTLEAVESQLAIQFPDRRGEAYDRASGALRELKKKVETQMHRVFSFLDDVADAHVPIQFNKYRYAVAQAIEDEIQFEDVRQYLYVSVDEDRNLVFTSYMMLINVSNSNGNKTPHLFVSLQWVVGSLIYVQVNHEFELPQALSKETSTEVKSAAAAVQAITNALAAEGFSVAAIARLTS